MLNSVSDLPIYWKRQILHCTKYMSILPFQLRSWKILYISCITLALKYCRCRICLQHTFPDFEKQWKIQYFFSCRVSTVFRLQYFLILVDHRDFCSFWKVRKVALETHLENLGLYEANSSYYLLLCLH